MSDKKRTHPVIKTNLHERNKHRGRYDFKLLIEISPELREFVSKNKYGDASIDFFNPLAVKALNRALLMHFYGLKFWEIPNGYLCPPIPGRADYIHYIAELLGSRNNSKIPKGPKITCLDVGVGANCVYPIIGNSEYEWSFVGTEIDSVAIKSANTIISSNPTLSGKIECRLQSNPSSIFLGIIDKDERLDLTICNPPFHESWAASQQSTLRKLSNLKNKKVTRAELNFGGKGNELWTEGGEKQFIINMIKQSAPFAKSCYWFSTLVSKKENLEFVYDEFYRQKVTEYKTIQMGQGNKISRIVAWTFLTKEEENNWIKERW